VAFSQLVVLVNNGNSTTSNVVIALPPAASTDPFDTPPGINAQQKPGVAGLVQGIRQNGCWDAAGLNYYPPAAILKVTPQ